MKQDNFLFPEVMPQTCVSTFYFSGLKCVGHLGQALKHSLYCKYLYDCTPKLLAPFAAVTGYIARVQSPEDGPKTS